MTRKRKWRVVEVSWSCTQEKTGVVLVEEKEGRSLRDHHEGVTAGFDYLLEKRLIINVEVTAEHNELLDVHVDGDDNANE